MSQFASLFKTDAKEKTETKKETKPVDGPKARQEKKKPGASKSSPASSPVVKAETVEASPPAKTEKRVAGKSSNPDFTQVLTYVRRDTHNRVKAALIFDEQRRDLSDLVEELLATWVKDNAR
jgi:hypothetical protein